MSGMTKAAPVRRTGWFADRSIKTKIASALGVLLLLTLVIAGVGVSSLNSARANLHDIVGMNRTYKETLDTLVLAQMRTRILLPMVGTSPTKTDRQQWMSEMDKTDQIIEDATAKLEDAGITSIAPSWATYQQDYATWTEQRKKVTDAGLAMNSAAFQKETAAAVPLVKQYSASQAATSKEVGDAFYARADAAASQISTAIITVIVTLVLGAALSIALGLYAANLVIRPIRKVEEVLDRMAEGDLTARADVHSRDEVGHMAGSLTRAQDAIVAAFDGVGRTSGRLRESAHELTTSVDGSRANARQASIVLDTVRGSSDTVSTNVQTVAAGTEEMTASIREISKSANDAAGVAASAVAVADQTNATVAKLGRRVRRSVRSSRPSRASRSRPTCWR